MALEALVHKGDNVLGKKVKIGMQGKVKPKSGFQNWNPPTSVFQRVRKLKDYGWSEPGELLSLNYGTSIRCVDKLPYGSLGVSMSSSIWLVTDPNSEHVGKFIFEYWHDSIREVL